MNDMSTDLIFIRCDVLVPQAYDDCPEKRIRMHTDRRR